MIKWMVISIWLCPVLGYTSTTLKDCGQYQIWGVVRKTYKQGGLVVKINEHSKSEYNLEISKKDRLKFAGFIDRSFTGEGEISKIDGTKALISNPQKLELRVPDPINPLRDSKLELLDKHGCINEK